MILSKPESANRRMVGLRILKSSGPNINIGISSDFITNRIKRLSVRWPMERSFGCQKSLNHQIYLKNNQKKFGNIKIILTFVSG